MCCDIGLDRRIPDSRDPLDISYVLLYRTQEDPRLSESSGHCQDPLDISYVL